MPCDKLILPLKKGRCCTAAAGSSFAEEVMNMNVSWTELLTFCLVILEVIELLVQITKKK